MSDPDLNQRGLMFAGITILIWAGFVIISRLGGQSVLTPFDVAALRTGTAALVLSPWWVPRLLKPGLRQLKAYQTMTFSLVAGLIYPLFAYGGFAYAPASHGAVLVSGLLPFFTTFFAIFLLAEKPGRSRLLGLCLTALGVALLFAASLRPDAPPTWKGDLMFVVASLMWGLFAVLIKRWKVRAFDVTLSVVSLSALVYLPVYVLFLPKQIQFAPMGTIALQAFYQGFVVVCVAMWTYARAAELLGAARLAVMMSSVPAIGTLAAVLLLGESLGTMTLMGVLLTSAGALVGAMARAAPAALSK